MNEWQPIETAPKDKMILLACLVFDVNDYHYPTIGRWITQPEIKNWENLKEVGELATYYIEGWYEQYGHYNGKSRMIPIHCEAQYWMPLPDSTDNMWRQISKWPIKYSDDDCDESTLMSDCITNNKHWPTLCEGHGTLSELVATMNGQSIKTHYNGCGGVREILVLVDKPCESKQYTIIGKVLDTSESYEYLRDYGLKSEDELNRDYHDGIDILESIMNSNHPDDICLYGIPFLQIDGIPKYWMPLPKPPMMEESDKKGDKK